MKRRILFYTLSVAAAAVLSIVLLDSCSGSKKASGTGNAPAMAKAAPAVTYEKDIKPIIFGACSPCHFPEKGKKKPLDTYAAVKSDINDILGRVQLPRTHEKFMPFKMKKEPLTDSQIALLKQWKELKTPEK